MSILRIYIVLGEGSMNLPDFDFKKEPRTNKLLEVVSNLNAEEIKNSFIILCGKSNFIYDVKETHAKVMRDYIIKKRPDLTRNIILEEESMDTLGDIYFSSIIMLHLIEDVGDDYEKIQINLVTESFHIPRALNILNEMFSRWQNKCEVKTIKAKNKNKGILNKIKRLAIEPTIEKAIEMDLWNYRIATIQDYESYLFSLPIYREHYKPRKKLSDRPFVKYKFSVYGKAIEEKLKKRNKK